MTQPVPIPFSDWTPDAPELAPTSREILNAIPAENGAYRPFPAFVARTVPLSEQTPLALFVHRQEDGDTAFYVGYGGAILQWMGDEWRFRGVGFNAPSWSFASYGDQIFAVNEVDGLWTARRDEPFQPVQEAPPARYVARIEDFLFLGRLPGAPSTIRWSALNNPLSWRQSIETQAGGNVMPLGLGAVTGFGDEQYPTIFQERGVSVATYVGGELIWRIDRAEEERGCLSADSIRSIGQRVFLWSQDGPSMWDGQSLTPLGEGRFRRWARALINNNGALTLRSSLDRANNAILWACCTGERMSGMLWNFSSAAAGGLRAARFETASNMALLADAAPATLTGADGDPLRGDEVIDQLSGMTATGQLGAFNGAALEAVLETGDFQAAANRRQMLTELWPLIDAPAAVIRGQIAARAQTPGDPLIYQPEQAATASGMIPAFSEARTHRARLRIPAGTPWTHAQGVTATAAPAGMR